MSTSTGSRLLLAAVALTATIIPEAAMARRLRCPAPFASSCLERLYRRFDAAGACTRDLSRLFSEGVITDCWENGASATITGFGTGPGASRLVNSRGRVVLEGTTSGGTRLGAVEVRYPRRRLAWTLARSIAGDWTVTCPNDLVETYTAAEVAAAGGCGPLAECSPGTCPLP